MSFKEIESVDVAEEVSPVPERQTNHLDVIWDDDKIERYIGDDGRKLWRCLWCDRSFLQWNATKALLHVNKISGGDIRRCPSTSIDASHREEYKRLMQKQSTRKNSQKSLLETKKRSSDEYIVGAGKAYAATKRKKTSPTSISLEKSTASSSHGKQMQSQLSFGLDTPLSQDSSQSTRYVQQTLEESTGSKVDDQCMMAIADMIHSCGLPFSLASHHKFRLVLSLAKGVTSKFVPPGRNKVAGELLDLNYNLYKEKMGEMLCKEADIYGLTFFGDGATVKKSPLINILASSVHQPVGCLRIVDCSGHLESNGMKDAAYIADLFIPHISEMESKVPRCTDLVIFDGASNVQKAGSLLEAKFPHLSVIHGAEHVISLFYHDVFCLKEFELLKKFNRLIYRYFGSGSMHSPYAIFSKYSRDHNGGKCIGLIRAADTRMAGHVISMLRTLRLKDALINTISSAPFLQGKFKIEKKFIEILKNENTWDFMKKFVRAVFPMLIVLRLADEKEPVMDKLYFYVRRMDKTLENSKKILDEIQDMTDESSWAVMSELNVDGKVDDESDSDSCTENYETESSTDSDSDDVDSGKPTKTLGQKVLDLWNKRRNKLVSDFAIAGWLLSPIPEVYKDSSTYMTGIHRAAVDRLLKKMIAYGLADDSDELAAIMNTFWSEFEDFKSRSGPFFEKYIWNEKATDLVLGKSHMWHKKYSLCSTQVLGRFACRVCSKIVGMGSAERNWGDVKYLKSEKRSHMSPEAVEKQATIFGASCMADAMLQRKRAQQNTTDPYKFWEEEDFDKEFDMFALKEPPKPLQRILKCYFETWEEEHIRKKDDVSKAKFLQKYGGLEFEDIDNGAHVRIDSNEMYYQRRSKHDQGGWCVITYVKDGTGDESDSTPWSIDKGCALHDCLAAYYRKHPDKNVQVVLRKEQEKEIEEMLVVIKDKQVTTTPASQKKRKAIPGGLELCGGCGLQVGPVHKCDVCKRNMHPFCGRTIGEEGYGSSVRCPKCDETTLSQLTM